jgi:hypothetical protein
VLEILSDIIGFPMQELQDWVKELSHLNLVVSWMPTTILHILHIKIMQEIRLHAELGYKELTKVIDEKEEIRKKYTTALHEKSEVEEKFERAMKEKNDIKEKAKKN